MAEPALKAPLPAPAAGAGAAPGLVRLQALAPPPVAKPQEAKAGGALEILLKIEADARRASTVDELTFLIAYETPKITRCRQAFVVLAKAKGGRSIRVKGVSAISQVDHNAPRIRWISGIIAALGKDAGLASAREFTLPAYTPKNDEEHKTFPFRSMLWVPLKLGDGALFAGMLLAREIPWLEADQVVAKRLGETYAHAWSALVGPRKLKRTFRATPWIVAASLIGLVAAGFYPVPLRVLAPLKISAVSSKVVAAPLDGTINTIEVEPNAAVKEGDIVIRMADTALRNELSIASEDVAVAEARLKLVSQAAVNDPKMRRELAVTRADIALKKARRDYAKDMLDRSIVRAPASGIALYADKRDWLGRPVQTGERILEIADPSAIELEIDVAVQDSIAIAPGAPVRAFLDSDPLNPVDGVVRQASYEAKEIEGGLMAYRIRARLDAPASDALRLGIRGTAQISGADVPLAFWLFRRPLTTIRQWLGL